MSNYLKAAINVINTEIIAIQSLQSNLNQQFDLACQEILNCRGRLIITGMGKSGLVGKKIAATMASTGTPAFFVHPAEAGHGDLGMIVKGDVVLAISNSGNSDEINLLLPVIKHFGIPLISITKDLSGRLSKEAKIPLTLGEFNEACPMGLAPTSSATATMVLGDALAIALLEARNFNHLDFAFSHPAGSLGKKLLTQVSDIMKSGEDIPLVSGNISVMDALFEITAKRIGVTAVKTEQGYGILTDGDLRRLLTKKQDLNTPIIQVMTKNPVTTTPDVMASDALQIMKKKEISQLLVLANGELVGVLVLNDLIQAGIS